MSRRFDFMRASSKGAAVVAAAPAVVIPPVSIWPAGITPPTFLPASTGNFNTTGTAVTTNLALTNAIRDALPGQNIYVASGTYAPLSPPARNIGSNPIRIVAVTPGGVVFAGAYNTGGNYNPALFLSSAWNGIAFDGCKFQINDAPLSASVPFYRIASINASSNVTFRNCEFQGSADANNVRTGWGIIADGATNLNVFGCYFHDLVHGNLLTNVIGFQGICNKFEFIASDGFNTMGPQNFKIYYNYGINYRNYSGEHPDLFQIFTTLASSQYSDNIMLYRNAVFCDPFQPLDAGNTIVSSGRSQGFTLQNEKGVIYGISNLTARGNIFYGTEAQGIHHYSTGADTNMNFIDNEIYHMAGISGDQVTFTRLFLEGGWPASGTVSGNIGQLYTVGATNMTGPQANTTQAGITKTPQDRDNAVTAWLAERAPFLALI